MKKENIKFKSGNIVIIVMTIDNNDDNEQYVFVRLQRSKGFRENIIS